MWLNLNLGATILGYTIIFLLISLGILFLGIYYLYLFDTTPRLKLERPWSEYNVQLPQNKEKISFVFYYWGSRGDLQPLAVLAWHLKQNGHSVLIHARERYHQAVFNLGLTEEELFPQSEDSAEELLAPQLQGKSGIEPLFKFLNFVAQNTDSYLNQLCEMVEKSNADVIVVNEFALTVGQLVAEKYQLPLFIYRYTPIFTSTTEWEFPFISDYKDRGSFLNWLSYLPATLIKIFTENRVVSEFRKRNNLPKRLFFQQMLGRYYWQFPSLFAFSDLMIRYPKKDIPAWYCNTGYLLPIAQENTEKIPDELVNFLASTPENEPIIYVGFGSFSITNFLKPEDAKKAALAILQGLEELGFKAIILRKTFDFMMEDSILNNPKWYVGRSFPHSWLFPKVSVIVHQAGAGHCSASARSGTPTVVMPAFPEQIYNAKTLLSLNIAVQLLLQQATKESFQAAVREALTLKYQALIIGENFEKQVQQAGNIAVTGMLKWLT